MYTHRDQNALGAVFFLHLLYHAAICDLTRVSLPGFSFPLADAFHDAPVDFLLQCQRRAQFHAAEISTLIRNGLPHRGLAFDDPFVTDAVFESTKIQIVFAAVTPNESDFVRMTADRIRSNMELLHTLVEDDAGSNPYVREHTLPYTKTCPTHKLRFKPWCHFVWHLALRMLQ
jgi:hypothetical protein